MYMPLSNLGIILVLIIFSKNISMFSFFIMFYNSNHHASSLVLIKLVYQTKFSYYIIMFIEVLRMNINLLIQEYITLTVTSVSIPNLIQRVLRNGVHNWPQTDHNSYNG